MDIALTFWPLLHGQMMAGTHTFRMKQDPNDSYLDILNAVEDLYPEELDLFKVHWPGQLKLQIMPNTVS